MHASSKAALSHTPVFVTAPAAILGLIPMSRSAGVIAERQPTALAIQLAASRIA